MLAQIYCPVHGIGGIIGTLLVAVFVSSQFGGAGLAEGMTISSQLGVQFTAVISVVLWTAVASFVILKITNAISGNRVTDDDERIGLDLTQHEEKGYDL